MVSAEFLAPRSISKISTPIEHDSDRPRTSTLAWRAMVSSLGRTPSFQPLPSTWHYRVQAKSPLDRDKPLTAVVVHRDPGRDKVPEGQFKPKVPSSGSCSVPGQRQGRSVPGPHFQAQFLLKKAESEWGPRSPQWPSKKEDRAARAGKWLWL